MHGFLKASRAAQRDWDLRKLKTLCRCPIIQEVGDSKAEPRSPTDKMKAFLAKEEVNTALVRKPEKAERSLGFS